MTAGDIPAGHSDTQESGRIARGINLEPIVGIGPLQPPLCKIYPVYVQTLKRMQTSWNDKTRSRGFNSAFY